jgi:hypothetical protein
VVVALMPLMVGRLDEGLRSEIKGGGGGTKAWSEDLAWHLEVGGRAALGDRRRREEVATVGQRGKEDESDSPGPLDREMRRRQPAQKARTKRENILPQLRH